MTNEIIIDNRYAITLCEPTKILNRIPNLVLNEIKFTKENERVLAVIAHYPTRVSLVSDLIHHRIYRSGINSISALVEETKRLAELCENGFKGFHSPNLLPK
ncbi:DUF5405 family protein [Yersinia mollaretii]|uniref:DUF5405 family protein n=1 Tax=Yersinia mollaretii TaxID=33060 RepID=UPI0025AA5C2F|nr:DUF5405 family protein [Yersinia mollaretii]MDN0111518.1 DUF5405 family protein [Yersinia mollaretii]